LGTYALQDVVDGPVLSHGVFVYIQAGVADRSSQAKNRWTFERRAVTLAAGGDSTSGVPLNREERVW
jgi:hypothetical protein